MKTCAHESFTYRTAISELLGVFCSKIQDSTPLLREIIKLTVECKIVASCFMTSDTRSSRYLSPT
jgi:hypothetical protein